MLLVNLFEFLKEFCVWSDSIEPLFAFLFLYSLHQLVAPNLQPPLNSIKSTKLATHFLTQPKPKQHLEPILISRVPIPLPKLSSTTKASYHTYPSFSSSASSCPNPTHSTYSKPFYQLKAYSFDQVSPWPTKP